MGHCSASALLRAQQTALSELMTGENGENAVHKMGESKDSQMPSHVNVTKIDEKRLNQEWSNEAMIANLTFSFQTNVTKWYPTLSLCRTVICAGLT